MKLNKTMLTSVAVLCITTFGYVAAATASVQFFQASQQGGPRGAGAALSFPASFLVTQSGGGSQPTYYKVESTPFSPTTGTMTISTGISTTCFAYGSVAFTADPSHGIAVAPGTYQMAFQRGCSSLSVVANITGDMGIGYTVIVQYQAKK